MTDTARLRSCLLAGLVLGAGCDSTSAPPSTPEQSVAQATQTAKVEPSATKLDVGAQPTEPTKKLDVGSPEPEPEPKAPPQPESEPKPPPVPERIKTGPRGCPTSHACWPKTEAKKLAVGKRRTKGCPTTVKGSEDRPKHGAWLMPNEKAKYSSHQTELRQGRAEEAICCYEWVERCPGGRPILDERGDLVRPALATTLVGAEDPARNAAAHAWLDDARTEAASVASFERVLDELQAVHAPAELCEGARQAIEDEQRHAAACLSVARRLGVHGTLGTNPEPARREATLAQLARDTFTEGAVGETIAALCATRAAEHCSDPAIRQVLERIAEDEARHAQLAWQTLAWAVREGGPGVLSSITAEARRAATAMDGATTSEPDAAPWGRLSPTAQHRARFDAWREVIEPLLDELVQHAA